METPAAGGKFWEYLGITKGETAPETPAAGENFTDIGHY